MIEFLFDLLQFLFKEWSRFYACLLLAIATSSLLLLLVPSRNLSIVVSIAVILAGLIGGITWERRRR